MADGCERCTSRLLAAGFFLVKFQMPRRTAGTAQSVLWAQRACRESSTARRLVVRRASRLPSARRVQNKRAAAPDQPLVVGGVVPRRGLRRKEPGKPCVIVQRLAHGVALDRDRPFGIDELGAKALEERTRGTNRILRRAEPNAEGESGLVTCLCCLDERI